MTPRPEYFAWTSCAIEMLPSKKIVPRTTNDPGEPGVHAMRPRRAPVASSTRQSYAVFGKRSTVGLLRSMMVLLSKPPGDEPVVHGWRGPGIAFWYQSARSSGGLDIAIRFESAGDVP